MPFKNMALHCVVHPWIAGGSDESLQQAGNLQGEICCDVVSAIRSRHCPKGLNLFLEGLFVCCAFVSESKFHKCFTFIF